jgi:F0F1-type ATP synthase epsilon subunit
VTKNHSPVIAELKAGVVQIVHEPGQAPEKYFVSGGFALTHANSVTVRSEGVAAAAVNVLEGKGERKGQEIVGRRLRRSFV